MLYYQNKNKVWTKLPKLNLLNLAILIYALQSAFYIKDAIKKLKLSLQDFKLNGNIPTILIKIMILRNSSK